MINKKNTFDQVEEELQFAYKNGAGVEPGPDWHTNVMHNIRKLNSELSDNDHSDVISFYIIKSAYFAAAAALIVVGLILQTGTFAYLDSGGWLLNETFTIIPN